MSKPSISHRIDQRLQRFLSRWAARVQTGESSVTGVKLGDEPPVVVMTDFAFLQTLRERPDFWADLQGRHSMVVLLRSWEIRLPVHLKSWVTLIEQRRREYPKQRVVYAANSASELPLLEAAGIEAVWCNHNALVDERVFHPGVDAREGDAREFDAIYDARFSRFKRHELATQIERLALIHFASPGLCEPLWWMATRWRLRHAKILNRERWGFWPIWLSPAEVAAANNRARVGLCLSAAEGAMVASIQYLLCGLPVVTTPSRGGRDVFFDSDNSIEVKPEPQAVAAAVRELIDRRVDPWAIRARTIKRMMEHRKRLIAYVEDFQMSHGVPVERRLGIEWARRQGNAFKDRLG